MAISMGEMVERLDKLEKDHQKLLEMFVSQKAGMCIAFSAISAALREMPDLDSGMLHSILSNSLQGWPLSGIPDNEANETAFAAPLRFLIQEHTETREKFRTRNR